MSDLERWLQRQAARERRGVILEEGLLGDRLWQYAWYRLRWFFLSYVVESITHGVTVLFLFRGLAWDNFLLVLVATAATSLVSAFWWGALEGLRARVRDLHRSGSPHRIPRTIGGWLALTLLISGGLLVLLVGWIVWSLLDGSFGPAEAYVAALFLRLVVDLPTRTYHSGVYALRRVYKPLPATLGPEVLQLAAMLVLWPLVGVWALVFGALLNTTLMTAFSLLYTRRVYYFLGFAPLREARLDTMRDALRGAARETLAGGFAHAVMALDALAVLALLYKAETDSQALLVLFFAMPTIRAGADWARLLYFDLKRLELRLFTNLRKRFERHTLQLAWLLAVVFWVVAAAIVTAYYGRDAGLLVGALFAFFVARSLLARAQIQAFAEGAYGTVLGTGFLCLVGLGAVGPLAGSEAERMAGIAIVAALSAIALSQLRGTARRRGEPGTALLTLEWLQRLGHLRTPVLVGSARIISSGAPERMETRTREDRNRWRLSQLAERTARRLGSTGAAAWVGPDRVVWFEPPDARRVDADWLQRVSGGLVAQIVERECANGEEALLEAGRGELLGLASGHLLTAIVPVDVDEARRAFQELIPGGVVFAPEEDVPPEMAAMPGSELRAILQDASAFARDLRIGKRRSKSDVTALCAGGELRLILIAELQAGREKRGRWRHLVTTLNVRAAIGGVRTGMRPARDRRRTLAA
jgi:hypothetical protein